MSLEFSLSGKWQLCFRPSENVRVQPHPSVRVLRRVHQLQVQVRRRRVPHLRGLRQGQVRRVRIIRTHNVCWQHKCRKKIVVFLDKNIFE